MKVGIAGGGITGLACAHYLRRAGIQATVFDPSPGGLTGSSEVQGCLLETGAESWLASKPWLETLIREVGLGDQIVGSNDSRRRTYVLRHGRFETLPEGLQLVVPTKLLPVLKTQLFSWRTKLRMGAEIFRSPRALADRSVSDFVADHFGREAVDYLAEPLLAGVYGGSPDFLSAPSVLSKFVEHEQRYGSVVVGALREKKAATGKPVFCGMRHGMGSFIRVLADAADIVPTRVDGIDFNGEWQVSADGASHTFDHVVLSCGANRAADLVRPVEPVAGDLLDSIPHSGSAIWTMGYRREDVQHPLDAFGFLIPKRERNAIMACTWIGTKWVGRVPEDMAALRCFSSDPGTTSEAIRADLRRLMGITAEPAFAVLNQWPESMPQYTVGHTARIAELEARIAELPGLHLAGNAYHGIGLPDCVRSGKRAADAIMRSRL